MSHKICGPDWFSRLDIFWLETDGYSRWVYLLYKEDIDTIQGGKGVYLLYSGTGRSIYTIEGGGYTNYSGGGCIYTYRRGVHII